MYAGSDDEGSVAGNFSNRWPGAQAGSASATTEVRSLVTGEILTTTATPRGIAQGQNAIWFGGGLTHMAVNGATINTIDDLTFAASPYLATGLRSTGNKSTPTLKADLLGDWREELVLRAADDRLAIVTTLAPTEYGIRTLMHDPMYRNGVANKNTGYDQVGFASFYLGDEAELPSRRTDIVIGVPATVADTLAELEGYVVAGEVSGPIVQQLRNALRQADRHIEADRPEAAVPALERGLAGSIVPSAATRSPRRPVPTWSPSFTA